MLLKPHTSTYNYDRFLKKLYCYVNYDLAQGRANMSIALEFNLSVYYTLYASMFLDNYK